MKKIITILILCLYLNGCIGLPSYNYLRIDNLSDNVSVLHYNVSQLSNGTFSGNNTDNQTLSFSEITNILSIIGGNEVNLSSLEDSFIDTNETSRFDSLVGGDCSGTDKMIGVDSNGNVVCDSDVDTDTDTILTVGTENYIPKFGVSDLADSSLVDDGSKVYTTSNVGVGISTPAGKLDVQNGDFFWNSPDDDYIASIGGSENIYINDIDEFITINTSSSERFRISSSGNVGIGDTTPDTILDVEGDYLTFTDGTGGGTGTLRLGEINGAVIGLYSADQIGIRSNSGLKLAGASTTMTGNVDIEIESDRDVMINRAGGQTGIGTALDTDFQLHVTGDALGVTSSGSVTPTFASGAGDLYVQNDVEVDGNSYLVDIFADDIDTDTILLTETSEALRLAAEWGGIDDLILVEDTLSGDAWKMTIVGSEEVDITHHNGDYVLQNGWFFADEDKGIGIGSSTERIIFDGTGNEIEFMGATGGVGIGTQSPSEDLTILDTSGAGVDYLQLLISSSTSNAGIKMESTFGGYNAWEMQAGAGNDFLIYDRTDLQYAMYFESATDDIGIYNSNPSYTLDVSGDGRYTSNLWVDGNLADPSQSVLTINDDVYAAGGSVYVASGNNFNKHCMWGSSDTNYCIGMYSGRTYGYLNDYAMTFGMSNTANRGWLWRDTSDGSSDGAMSLTTDGRLTVKSTSNFQGSVGIGTSTPSGKLQVEGDEMRVGNAGTVNFATGDGDLYVEDTLEVDVAARIEDIYVNDVFVSGTAGLDDTIVFVDADSCEHEIVYNEGIVTSHDVNC